MSSANRASLLRDLTTWRFWSRFLTHFFAALGLQGAVVGMTSALFPTLLPPFGWGLVVLLAATAIGWATWKAWPRPIVQAFQQPATEIRVVVGDLLDQSGHLVIGMSTTFDTELPHIISSTSLQGQFLNRLYSGDRNALDSHLAQALNSIQSASVFSPSDGKAGKQVRYPMGTVAVVSQSPRVLYFCLAYTDMQADCTVRTTVDDVWASLNELWRAVDARGNGDPVSIAAIGGGQSRLSQQLPLQDSVRLTMLSYMFASRVRPIARQLNIVIRPDDLSRLDVLELQAFLRSLKPS